MKIISRAAWGARAPKHRTTRQMTDESSLHWNGPTVTVGGKTTWDHSKCAPLVRGIQNFHMDGRGWSDIAYNFVVCPHRFIFEGRGINVINGANGTNAGNRSSHAIMNLAGEGNVFSEEEKAGNKDCVLYISSRSKAPNKCKGHRDHKSTECPGNERYSWVHSGMPVGNAAPTPVEPEQTKRKDSGMEAALLLVKIHYDNIRGDGSGTYDVQKSDPNGYTHWVNLLLEAYDRGHPLKGVTDKLAMTLITREGKK